jgi:hypothetical protein
MISKCLRLKYHHKISKIDLLDNVPNSANNAYFVFDLSVSNDTVHEHIIDDFS